MSPAFTWSNSGVRPSYSGIWSLECTSSGRPPDSPGGSTLKSRLWPSPSSSAAATAVDPSRRTQMIATISFFDIDSPL